MQAILDNIGLWVTEASTWLETAFGTITKSGNELLLVGFYTGMIGVGFGLVRRAIKVFR